MIRIKTGGRIGDIIFQLYTVEKLAKGGQVDIVIDIEHHKNPPEAWNREMAESLIPLLRHQPYIRNAFIDDGLPCEFNMIDAENATPDHAAFPEWRGPNSPGNIHIAKRYAHHFAEFGAPTRGVAVVRC